MKITLGVAHRVCRVWVASVGLWFGVSGCGESNDDSDAMADGGAQSGAMGSSGAGGMTAGESGSGGSDAPGPDAGTPSFEDPFPDDVIIPTRGPCTAGETRACTFDLLCTGTQTCSSDGQGFGECDCGGAIVKGGDALVGTRCESDLDCAQGGVCFTADGNMFVGQGGPAGGYCTFECTDTAECQAIDPRSQCAGWGPDRARFCIRTCETKDPEPGEDKCLNRPDVVCRSIVYDGVESFSAERQRGVCEPRCGSDADCPAGRVCHRQGGVCDDVQIGGAPSGSRCTLDSECDGRECIDRDAAGVGTCTALCTLGSLSGCGFARDSEDRGAACLVPIISSGNFSEGVGDLGACQQLCDVAADCFRADEGATCAMLQPAAAAFLGRPGVCVGP
jgi:hypothetical protein